MPGTRENRSTPNAIGNRRRVFPVIRQLAGGMVIGLMATVFAISFASIIYSGPLSPSLDRGIGLALLGGAVMSGLGALLFSFRGTVTHSQDITAILLGVDLLWTWLWSERRRLQPRDIAIVLVILATAATVGFLEALAVGMVVAMTLFIVSYAGLDFVRLQTTLANRRSMVERSDPARTHLTSAGGAVIVLELSGVLFFGTAARLRDRILEVLDAAETPPAAVVLDFRRVRDLDASAAVSLERTFEELRGLGVAVRLCALAADAVARLRRDGPLQPRVHPTLDDALQDLEETLLRGLDPATSDHGSILGKLKREHPGVDLEALFPVTHFAPGAVMIVEDSPSDEIFILIDGEASATVGAGEPARVVARFLPGALIGEMAYYGGVRRSASVRADRDVRALRIEASLLGPGSPLPPDIVSTIQRLAAGTLSQRLARTNRLLRDADD